MVQDGSDELIQKIRGEYLFSDPLSMWLLISIKILIKSYQIWLHPKILDLTLIIVLDGFIAGVFYEIYQAKYNFWVLLMLKLLGSTQFLVKTDPYFQKIWNNHNFTIVHFKNILIWFFISIKFLIKFLIWDTIQLLLDIPTPNQYGQRVQDNGRGLGPIEPDPKIIPRIFTFSEVYGFHFNSEKPWSDWKLNCLS